MNHKRFFRFKISLKSCRPNEARIVGNRKLVSSGSGRSAEQGDINALMTGLAKKGKHVVRLTGGDPSGSLHGIAAEETPASSTAVPAPSAARSGAAA
jgi:siroheme synthase